MNLEINNRDKALFESGIKLGSLYHQFIGTPINLENTDIIIKCIEKSISLQPYVKNVKVVLNTKYISEKINKEFKYTELNGKMIEATIKVQYKEYIVFAVLNYDSINKYPLMKIISIKKYKDDI